MSGGVSIKVAVRCRPFTIDDKLGVKLRQNGPDEGEVELINSDYTTSRFPFTYAWWSAYGYKRHLIGDNMPDADEMQLVDQASAYEQCGKKIKDDLLGGNAVVLFAYGLSGSGKTYTVFGPDAVDAPEAWFKHPDPQPLWGIFPRLAYELFQEKQEGWKISMKYFQNVVDTVRDLMSPNAEEQHYKNGMRKDPDGFMDIEWCLTKVLHSWNDLREQFQIANSRKAIAPTQFNPMSTRGHCIMVLEVEMPNPDNPEVKQRGRVYVCDLAGTEPAGDIVYAMYNKVTFDDGSFEYKYTGAHPDMKKTKELQEQGKKINLSLSEMAQFFMKMAEAFQKKKLVPGASIPGCNSFFLCKYLKDTMLQARTYLFCAVRPEVTYLKYTFATLGFAKNASVVKLAPKKATVAASAAERKLMQELEAMKALVAQLQQQTTTVSAAASGGSDADRIIAELQAKLAEKQSDLNSLNEGNSSTADAQMQEQQRAEYARRGISFVAYDLESNPHPYFVNVDSDAFRSNRFMYICRPGTTTFGNKCDIQLMSLAVIRDHCLVRYEEASSTVVLRAGKGDTFHNGKHLNEGDEVTLALYDRIKEAKQIVDLMNRVTMSFDVVLEKGSNGPNSPRAPQDPQQALASQIPRVKICVENSSPKLSIVIDPQEFLPKLALLKDELMKLRSAIDAGRTYEIPERHDPLYLMFDNDFHLGTATHWPEYLLYNLETDEEERMQEIKNVAVPYNTVGLLEVKWTPLSSPNDDPSDPASFAGPILEVEKEEDLLGKPWTYNLTIVRATDLPVFCDSAYISYDFFGENFTTENVQQTTFSPVFEYHKVHHIPCVTQEFLAYLKGSIEMQIHVTQHIDPPLDKINTDNPIVAESIRTGEPKGYEMNDKVKRPKTEAEIRCEQLTKDLSDAREMNSSLTRHIQQLEEKLRQYEPNHVSVLTELHHVPRGSLSRPTSSAVGHAGSRLRDAQIIDHVVNG
eukprot:gene3736-2647_t